MDIINYNKTETERTGFFKRFTEGNLENIILFSVIIALIVIFTFLSPVFFKFITFMNMFRRLSVLSMLSIGMTFILLIGGLDLSIGSAVAFAGACSAAVLLATNSIILSMLTAILVGCGIGFINGFMISKVKLNPVVATLAMMGIARTGALFVTESTPISVDNEAYKWIGQAYIGKGLNSIPIVIFFMIVFFVIFHFILKKTVFGKNVYAIGGNSSAAKASGIPVEKNTVLVYLLNGFLVGIGSIILVGRASAAIPWAGLGMEFDAITVVILGGTSLSGGEGDLKGTLLGLMLYGILLTGLSMMEISPYYQTIVKGLLLLFSVLMNKKLEEKGKAGA